MMELADVLDSKSSGSDTVRVRPPLPAPKKENSDLSLFSFFATVIGIGRIRPFAYGERKVQTPALTLFVVGSGIGQIRHRA